MEEWLTLLSGRQPHKARAETPASPQSCRHLVDDWGFATPAGPFGRRKPALRDRPRAQGARVCLKGKKRVGNGISRDYNALSILSVTVIIPPIQITCMLSKYMISLVP